MKMSLLTWILSLTRFWFLVQSGPHPHPNQHKQHPQKPHLGHGTLVGLLSVSSELESIMANMLADTGVFYGKPSCDFNANVYTIREMITAVSHMDLSKSKII